MKTPLGTEALRSMWLFSLGVCKICKTCVVCWYVWQCAMNFLSFFFFSWFSVVFEFVLWLNRGASKDCLRDLKIQKPPTKDFFFLSLNDKTLEVECFVALRSPIKLLLLFLPTLDLHYICLSFWHFYHFSLQMSPYFTVFRKCACVVMDCSNYIHYV